MKLSKTLGVACATALVATLAVAMEDTQPVSVTGTVTGTILFDGELPKIRPLTISAEQAAGCCAEGESVSDVDMSLLVDEKTKGIANVAVTLTVADHKVEIPEEPYLVDQKKCRFEPHLTIIPAGATVAYANSDTVAHNIHTYSVKNEGVNQTVAADQKLRQKLEIAEPVKVACDIHPWMGGWVFVTEGTHWAKSNRDGTFSIEGVPPGEYKLEIWHEKLGKGKGTAVVKADGSCEAVVVEMGEKKKRRGR